MTTKIVDFVFLKSSSKSNYAQSLLSFLLICFIYSVKKAKKYLNQYG